ncbi:MAG: phosphoribosyltransferase [Deltaproteobacteria bacterium]|nr:phosphoribosyltransferase [Deltaproteobacteria bacterium]MBW1952908.1 phosphoribosyltransferase [Deltaproteobacteria bacterium]MBW1987142.1 phosphoribosyltransferase [Deltaproteobacteria bacterium]MBW2135354.1 phosphoribosyltransferase [Deltaproteobacteria bacterium]
MAIIEEPKFRDKVQVFSDRAAAGKGLAQKLEKYKHTQSLVLGIPSGGMPVASEIARGLDLPLDLLIVRKVQIPWNPEAGFGAVNPDGEVIFNESLLPRLRLKPAEIEEQVNKTMEILRQRQALFRGGRPFPDLTNNSVIVADDGLASGYTMLAAIKFIQKRHPAKIIVAVPTGFLKTVRFIEPKVDELVCLNIRGGLAFAVADAYQNWYDLTDTEVMAFMEKYQPAQRP